MQNNSSEKPEKCTGTNCVGEEHLHTFYGNVFYTCSMWSECVCVYAQEVVSLYKKTHAIIKVLTAHWATSFITYRPVCVYSCPQLRELWFNDLLTLCTCT